ncbi:Hypothetical protein mma_2191 [Janthinobacterium sp. Marseille]|nr:hypothetical protein [Janthinobacterium sp. Marseille]ABR91900.1 Hypothetical protein mma_2191 [Janthinobacterium sp. Marseille]
MTYYKAPNNSIHFLDDEKFEHLLPAGSVLITDEEAAQIQSQQLPSKEDRITALQEAYEIDLDKLNKAWLAALIADGAGEVARQAGIKTQMLDLADQLDLDILTIIMEE